MTKHQQKKRTTGSVRIISGIWRGRKLPVHDIEGLRPTTDRVKETLFNWLAQEIPQAKCLDLFAGSGSLGFEAASHQAESVTMLEINRNAYSQLEENSKLLNASQIQVINTDALKYLEQKGVTYDIVFIDPPFHKNLLEKSIKLLEENEWLSDGAMIYLEMESEIIQTIQTPSNWQLYRSKIAGQVGYQLFRKC